MRHLRVTTTRDVLPAAGRVSVGQGTRRAHAWVVRWVVGAVSVNRRRASGGYRHALSASRASLISHWPTTASNKPPMETTLVKLFCVAENCGLCGIRMKETYFCTKTKNIQKKSQKCTENRGNEKSKCDLYGYGIDCAGEVFFALGIGLL
jgi:hypothetical protein